MAIFLSTIAMVVTFFASWYGIFLLGWLFVYGDNGPSKVVITIMPLIAAGLGLLVFVGVYKLLKRVRARRMPKSAAAPPRWAVGRFR